MNWPRADIALALNCCKFRDLILATDLKSAQSQKARPHQKNHHLRVDIGSRIPDQQRTQFAPDALTYSKAHSCNKSTNMRRICDRAECSADAEQHPENRQNQLIAWYPEPCTWLSSTFHPQVTNQAKINARHSTEITGRLSRIESHHPPILPNVGCDRQHQNQCDNSPCAACKFDATSEIPQPHHVEENMQHAEMQEDRRYESPDLTTL